MELGQSASPAAPSPYARGGMAGYKSQLKFEKRVLRLVRMRQHVESHLHPVILHLHESVSPDWDIMWRPMEEELRYLIQLHRKPLRLQDLARISIRKAVSGQHFKVKVRNLPIPTKMKAFVRADITHQLLTRVFADFFYFSVVFFFVFICQCWRVFNNKDSVRGKKY